MVKNIEYRNISFCVILIQAGLFLDLKSLQKDYRKILSLSVFPCLVETAAFGIAATYILQIPFLWAFLMGFVLICLFFKSKIKTK